MKRRSMGKVKRSDIVNNARKVGRSEAIKKRQVVYCVGATSPLLDDFLCHRDMIAGSKRRKDKVDTERGVEDDDQTAH